MNPHHFCTAFDRHFPAREVGRPTPILEQAFARSFFDPCFDVEGMTSPKKQRLLSLAFSLLDPDEAYLEIGTYHGKSLISAMLGHPPRPVFACDNFSEFTATNSIERVEANLRRYGLREQVTLYDADFRTIFAREKLPVPVGVYFYDGAHDDESQYAAIRDVEPFLADEALVVIDDWRFAPDSQSFAKAATERAVKASRHDWRRLYELPARYNGDHGMWWNGVGVLAFRRRG